MRRALVLAGGGARGSYQVGMLQSLVLDQRLDFSIIRGVSVGALNASFLAQAPSSPDPVAALQRKVVELEELWRREIRGNQSVYKKRVGGFGGLVGGADSIYSLKPLRGLIAKHVALDALRTSGRDFKVGTASLVSARYQEWGPEDPAFLEKLMASASIPAVFPFVEVKAERDVLVDGGVRNITPLSGTFAAKPDEIYVLLTSRLIRTGSELPDSGATEENYEQWQDNWLGTKVNGLKVLERTIEILSDEIYLDDLRGALSWNALLKSKDAVVAAAGGAPANGELARAIAELQQSTEKRHVPIHVLAPREWYGKSNSSTEFSPELIARAIDHGREIGADRSKWLWP